MFPCAYLLPSVVNQFKSLYPLIELEVVTGPHESLLRLIRDYSIDLAVITLPAPQPDLTVVPLCTEELVVVTSKNHSALSHKQWVTAKELEGYRFIIYSKITSARRLLEHFFHQSRINPRIAMEAEQESTMFPLVEIDAGISILPLRMVAEEQKRKKLHYLRIRNYKIEVHIGLVHHKSSYTPKILSEMIRLFRESQENST